MTVAGVATCLVSRIDKALLDHEYLGGYALGSALTIAWGLWFPDRIVRIYLVLPIRGFWLGKNPIGLPHASRTAVCFSVGCSRPSSAETYGPFTYSA